MDAAPYILDPEDPRAPPQEVWARLTAAERERLIASLPSELPLASPPEGDAHRHAKERAYQTLDEYFRQIHRKVYLSSELPVYYPGEPMFAPDIIAVLDASNHERPHWVVDHEGKGLDFALEIHLRGSHDKDFRRNVERFARLGIPEYFALDLSRSRLLGWRLDPDAPRTYSRIVPQTGRWSSHVLGLDLALTDSRLTFLHGSAELLDGRALIGKLSTMVDDAVRRAEEESRRAEEESRRAEEESRRAEEESRRASALEAKLRELGIDPDA